jgi:hypothetical protein
MHPAAVASTRTAERERLEPALLNTHVWTIRNPLAKAGSVVSGQVRSAQRGTTLYPAKALRARPASVRVEGPVTAWRAFGMIGELLAPPSYGVGMGEFRKTKVYDDYWSSVEVEAVCPLSPEGGCPQSADGRVPGGYDGSGHICGIHTYLTWAMLNDSGRWVRAGRRFAVKLELTGKILREVGAPDRWEHYPRGACVHPVRGLPPAGCPRRRAHRRALGRAARRAGNGRRRERADGAVSALERQAWPAPSNNPLVQRLRVSAHGTSPEHRTHLKLTPARDLGPGAAT